MAAVQGRVLSVEKETNATISSLLFTRLGYQPFKSFRGKHFDLEETEILKQMKNLVVRFEIPAVHVQTFLAMNQQPDEGVRHFLARLHGVATHCEFRVRCSCTKEVLYADNVIRFN